MSSSAGNKTHQVQQQVDEVVGIMQDNIHKVMQRGEQLDTLQNKTGKMSSQQTELTRQTTCKIHPFNLKEELIEFASKCGGRI